METGGGWVPPRPDKTSPPAPTARRRWGRLILLAVGVLILVPVAIAFWSGFIQGFRESLDRTPELRSFSDHGLSFEVPEGLHRLSEAELEQLSLTRVPGVPSPTGGAWFEAFVLDGSNILLVFPDELPWIVDESNLEAHAQLVRIGAGDVLGVELDVAASTLAGYPALELGPNDVETPDGIEATNWSVEAFDQNLGYGFLCQSAGPPASEMQRLCAMLLDSVTIEPTSSSLDRGWSTVESPLGHAIDVPPEWDEVALERDELLHAELLIPGALGPLAEVRLFADPIDGTPTPENYADTIVAEFGRRFTLNSRDRVTLPAGLAERLVFRNGNLNVTIFAFIDGSQGVSLILSTHAARHERSLLGPTVDAIARSLSIER
jgi:hypothetical protein